MSDHEHDENGESNEKTSDGVCNHRAGRKIWLDTQTGGLKLHPYCVNCGTIKNVSSDRGKKMGYFIRALSDLRKVLEMRGYKVSDAQIRLISKELSEYDGFDDLWWITFSKQKEIFVNVVCKYIRVSRELVESVL
jgi:hypothetical protein